ncbi:MAG: DNA-binding domain-containing protein [Candidatus Porifericomitaceae bacterium WSBS_2022_MAG_OTU9]
MSRQHGNPAPEPEPDGFAGVERSFTAHIRDHDKPLPPGVLDERMDVYRGLFFRNIESFLGGSFVVLRTILGDKRWAEIMHDYFSRHKATTPLFPRMPREFLLYLETLYEPHPDDPPFMMQLAHYEWVDQEVRIDIREIDETGIDPDGDLLEGVPVLNPLARLLQYDWPVHRIKPDYMPQQQAQVYLVVSRTRADQNTFVELNQVSARLLDLLAAASNSESGGKSTGRQMLLQIADELQAKDPTAIVSGGSEMLLRLLAKDIVLGTIASSS